MPVNLGLDDEYDAANAVTGSATGFAAKLLTLLEKGFKSTSNPFGTAAVKDTGTSSGDVPEIGANGKLDSSILPTQQSAHLIGEIKDLAGGSIPAGWAECNGQYLSRSTYSALYGKIGTTWGSGSGTFRVPDLRRRARIGRGGSRPSGSLGPTTGVGSSGGSETHRLTSSQTPDHSHKMFSSSVAPSNASQPTATSTIGRGWNIGNIHSWSARTVSGSPTVGQTSSSGSGGVHNNMPPSAVVISIIYHGVGG